MIYRDAVLSQGDAFLGCAQLSNSSLLCMFKHQARTVHVSFVPGTARHQYCWSAHICYCAESADCFASDDTMNIICLYSFCKKTAQGQRAGGAESGHAESLDGKSPSLHQTVCLRADMPNTCCREIEGGRLVVHVVRDLRSKQSRAEKAEAKTGKYAAPKVSVKELKLLFRGLSDQTVRYRLRDKCECIPVKVYLCMSGCLVVG